MVRRRLKGLVVAVVVTTIILLELLLADKQFPKKGGQIKQKGDLL